jgi:hypothetical protein
VSKRTAPIRKLSSVETLGVALVTRGANKKRWALKKSDGELMTVNELLVQIIAKGDMPVDDAAIAKLCEQAGVDAQGIEVVKAIIKLGNTYKDDPGFQKVLPQVMKMLGSAAGGDEGEEEPTEGEEPAEGEEGKDKPAPGKKPFPPKDGAKQDGKTAPDEGDKKETPMTEDEKKEFQAKSDALAKSADEAKDALAKSQKEAAELQALVKSQGEALKAMQEAVAKERDERALASWVAKADRDLRFVPGKTADELGKMLHTAEKALGAEAAQAQFDTFKAMSDTLAKSDMFRGAGTQSRGGDSKKDAYAQLQEKANAILEKSADMNTDPATARAKAMAKAIELFPALYAEYLNQNDAQRGAHQFAQ